MELENQNPKGKELKVNIDVKVKDLAFFKKLSEYFAKEISDGKDEFRVKITDIGKGYIHPLGKDGETHDFDYYQDLTKDDLESLAEEIK